MEAHYIRGRAHCTLLSAVLEKVIGRPVDGEDTTVSRRGSLVRAPKKLHSCRPERRANASIILAAHKSRNPHPPCPSE